MEFTSKCNHCDGTGGKTVTIADFVRAVFDAGTVNRINAIRDVRQLASDYRLPSGLRECKDFVVAVGDFSGEPYTFALTFVEALQEFEKYLRGGEARAYPVTQ